MVSWNLVSWSSPKGVRSCEQPRRAREGNAVSPSGVPGVQWQGEGRKVFTILQLAISNLLAPTTLFCYDTRALISSEAFHSHTFKTSSPTSYFYQLFLPSCPLPTSLSLLLEWSIKKKKNKTTHTQNSSCPSLYWASGDKAAEKNQTAAWVPAGSCQPQHPCLLRVQQLQYTQPGLRECRKGNLHVLDVIEVMWQR